jgi:HEAT repeat protein
MGRSGKRLAGTTVGLFDFLNKKGAQTPVQKLQAKVLDKRGMAPDRWDAIQALSKIDSEEAIEALLLRFTFKTDPSITDQEEKDSVFNAVVQKGPTAVEPLKRFIKKKSESISWPLKMLDRVLPAAQVLDLLLELLREMDTEYERDPDRKLQILAELESRKGPQVLEVVRPFLRDVNETARFHAVGALFAQAEAEDARQALLEALPKEESMRVKARILDGLSQRSWAVDPAAAGRLPDGWSVDGSGVPKKR